MSAESVERWDGIGIKRRIHLKCTDEYEQTGNGIFICNGNGKWKSDMVCNGKRLGCFEDNETRSFDPRNYHRLQNMDASVCRDHCLKIDQEFKYIGLQHGSACFCGHHVKFWNRRSDNECYITCPGNEKETCGGDWRNEIFTV
ncbi:sialate:O-sulfotransferase 1-like [Saccostrea cucullata]|uniref:sialate:O-sulfotransferase 1-like n=1 Tax=Saccostrea cuccullata TaxID=36930 RepID=UPI002ED2F023